MTRYEQIADVAIPRMKEFFDEREIVSAFARRLVVGYSEFLDAPKDAASFLKLDAYLEIIGDRVSTIQEAAPVQGCDGSWNFCFAMRFNKHGSPYFGIENRKIKVKVQAKKLIVSCGREFELSIPESCGLSEIFEYFFDDTRRTYSQPKVSNRIGFFVED